MPGATQIDDDWDVYVWCDVYYELIVGGLYSVTALRKNDQERVTVYTKHRLKLHSQTTRKRRRPEEVRHPRGRWPDRRDRPARSGERGGAGGCAPPFF